MLRRLLAEFLAALALPDPERWAADEDLVILLPDDHPPLWPDAQLDAELRQLLDEAAR